MGFSPIVRRAARVIIAVSVVSTAVVLAPTLASGAPNASAGLIGTWTAAGTTGITKIVISSAGAGAIKVDTFSKCGAPRLCEAGKVSAVVYGSSASSTNGAFFQTNQKIGSYNRVVLGHLVSTGAGPRITLAWFVVYNDGTRYNTWVAREFKRIGAASATTKTGTTTSAYPTSRQPTASSSFIGTWHNTNANTRGNVEFIITRAGNGSLLIHAFGACTPNPCDNGVSAGIAYGPSTSLNIGTRFLAPTDYGFKRVVVAGQTSGGILTVRSYDQFTDGSGRSNYATTETFAH